MPLKADRSPTRILAGLAWVAVYFVFAVAIVVGSSLGGQMLGKMFGRWMGPLFQTVAGMGGVLLLTWLFRVKLNKKPWAGMALPKPWVAHWLLGVCAGVFCILLLCGAEYALGWLHFARIDQAPHRGLPKIVWLLVAIAPSIWVGFVEELSFRGYIFQTLGERMPTWIAALIMGTAFGLAHFTLSGFGPGFVVSVLLLSTTFLTLRFATGSLWFPMGFHGAWDYTQTYLVGVSTTGSPGYDPSLVQVTQTGPALWVGGNPSIEGGLLAMGMIVMVLLAALAYASRAGRGPPWRRPVTSLGD